MVKALGQTGGEGTHTQREQESRGSQQAAGWPRARTAVTLEAPRQGATLSCEWRCLRTLKVKGD